MADEPVNQDENVNEDQTLGNEPDTSAENDGTAELENGDQNPVDSRDEAVGAGQDAARENAESERDDQPAPEGE